MWDATSRMSLRTHHRLTRSGVPKAVSQLGAALLTIRLIRSQWVMLLQLNQQSDKWHQKCRALGTMWTFVLLQEIFNLGFTDSYRIPSTFEKVLEPLITTWRGFFFVCSFFFIGGSCWVLKGPLIGEMLKHYLECQANFLAAWCIVLSGLALPIFGIKMNS